LKAEGGKGGETAAETGYQEKCLRCLALIDFPKTGRYANQE
jgi:hypothetical protein